MDRWACVDAFSFPLQLLLSLHPEWIDDPVAVLDRDHSRGRLTHLNRHARSARLQRGMPYGQALALLPHLRADTVDEALREKRSDELAETLSDFSPHIERNDAHRGTFWLDASGLEELYGQWQQWVTPLKERLRRDHDIYVSVVIGFSRFGTFAVARATKTSGAFDSVAAERRAAGAVALHQLDLAPAALKLTRRLGLHSINELLDLPAEGIQRRFGDEVFRLYRQARGDLRDPGTAFHISNAPSQVDHFDHSERDTNRLLFRIKRHLHRLLSTLEKEGEKLTRLTLILHLDDGDDPIHTEICPAEPSMEALLLLDLVRLRLETLPISKGITDVVITAHGEQTTTEQMSLFADHSRRDIDAANRALARLRAEFGAHTILRVTPRPGHLPESRFDLARLDELTLPESNAPTTETGPAVRRFFPAPIHLRTRPDTPIRAGPHTISGGWWVREVHRDYHLLTTDDQRLLWVFFDHRRQRWYLHGEF